MMMMMAMDHSAPLEPAPLVEVLQVRIRWIPHTYGMLVGWRSLDAYPARIAGFLAGLAGSSTTIPSERDDGDMFLFSAVDRPLPHLPLLEPGAQ